MKDKISVDRLNKLHPKVRTTFRNFIEDAEREFNITLRISQGLRTIAEQDALYAQGRTTPGKIVTNAKGGSSYHNYGLAIDLVELVGNKLGNFDMGKLKPLADRYGLIWGGTFETLYDPPHFEITFGYKPSQLAAIAKDKYGYPMI